MRKRPLLNTNILLISGKYGLRIRQGQLNTIESTVGLFRPSWVRFLIFMIWRQHISKKEASLGGRVGSSGFRSSLKLRTVDGFWVTFF